MRDEDRSAAERLLSVTLNAGAHLWHNRPGVAVGDRWYPAVKRQRARADGVAVPPGLFVPAAVDLYGRLLELYQLDPELMARFASYSLLHTEWRDLKVCCAALMLVQPKAGQPVRDPDGTVAFHDDDYRAIGEAMVLHYERGSTLMLTPRGVLRIAELLEIPEIAARNRAAGFADPAARKPPLGRWPRAAERWLAVRERNLPMLEGLVKAGYKETIKRIARKVGYRPASPVFFELLGWRQKQASGGHREVGLDGLELRRRERFDGMDEAAICARIEAERLSFKEVTGRLPAGLGLTPAIMAALLPSLSDRELRLLTPTLESLGLLADAGIRARWEEAVKTATDQRALNIARNVRDRELREKLEEASDAAARAAVSEAVADDQVEVMFLVDKSGSMENAIGASKEALSRILAGFPPDRLHIAAFDGTGRVLRPKAPTRTGVQHMLEGIRAGGGTLHAAAVRALHQAGVRIAEDAKLVVIVVGDENGETGTDFARSFSSYGYTPAAIGLLVSRAPDWPRGQTVRDAATALQVPYSEVTVDQFTDPYQVTRVLKTLMDAPVPTGAGGGHGWVDKVLATPLLEPPP